MKTITIPEAEYRWLHVVYIEALAVREKGVQQWNRMPPGLRLAVTTLISHYQERRLDERGLPVGVASPTAPVVEQPDPITIPCPTCNAKPGELCASVIDASKTRRESHAARRAA